MVTYPLYSEDKTLIGCLLFCYFKDNTPNHDNLNHMTKMIQTLIRPFHDEGNNIFHVKCIQISTEMPLLTSQEKRILKKLLKAKPYALIADEMHISLNTVKTHVKHIYAKYKVKSKLELYNKVKGITE
jgi:DNA-binding CsgD family transcriptional regulator